jgi:S1-C subfamily serine protease
MSDQLATQVTIRHLNGAKANKIEQYSLHDVPEITFGRDVGSTISYDSKRDDVVSRKHAVIRVKSNDPLAFAIEDLKSSNGTFVNGKKITGETDILPDDTVELGSGGPKFVFDLQPRPAGLAARTRVMSTIATTATRVVSAAALSEAPPTEKLTPPPKIGVGKDTVQMMLSHERRKTGHVWMGAVAALIAFVAIVGGAIHWHNSQAVEQVKREAQEQLHQAALQTERLRTQTAADIARQTTDLSQQLGITPPEIVSKFGDSIVVVNVRWRLYDRATGRPIYHKTVAHNGQNVPAYVKLEDGKNVRWLTTEDENRTNIEISEAGSGSGFVVASNGFILTNKHVAAAWLTDFSLPANLKGLIYRVTPLGKRPGRQQPTFVENIENDRGSDELTQWIPEVDGGFVFAGTQPVMTGAGKNLFYGRNETLEVRFPGNTLSINAALARAATLGDAALIKIDSPQPLTAVDLQTDDAIKVGERVVVMGYPGISTRTTATFMTGEGGRARMRNEDVPEPTVTDGIVSKLGTETQQKDGTQIGSRHGDAFQLTINATGAGNSGGPVFNSSGKVIGIFSFGLVKRNDLTRVSFAIPIKHGLLLLQPQRPQ